MVMLLWLILFVTMPLSYFLTYYCISSLGLFSICMKPWQEAAPRMLVEYGMLEAPMKIASPRYLLFTFLPFLRVLNWGGKTVMFELLY